METELLKFETLPAIRLETNGRSIRDPDIDLKYTSLKDIIPNSPTKNLTYHENGFDSSNISIRNQLVKQAASAYLQSAVILATRDQNCLVRLWRKLKNKDALHSCWCIYVRNPLRACVTSIGQLVAYMVNQIGSVWGGWRPILRNNCE